MKISEIINIVSPQYVYLRLRPNNSIRNNNTHLIARSINALYRTIWQVIRKDEERMISLLGRKIAIGTKWSYHRQCKVAYFLYLEQKRVEFYFIVPRQFLSIIKEKLGDVWANLTIEEVTNIPLFGAEATKKQLVYEKEDALSLRIDRRDNDLLSNMLNVIDVLEEEDRIGILYNFIPTSQGRFVHSYKSTLNKIKNGMPVERNKAGAAYAIKMFLALLDGLIKDVTEAVAGRNIKEHERSLLDNLIDRLNGGRKIKESTERKANAVILNSQIIVISESPDLLRQRNNAVSISQSFDSISDDNRLIAKPFKGKINFHARTIPGASINRVSDLESQHFIALAGRELLERYHFIDKVETQETKVPEELRSGVMCIGVNHYRGTEQAAYLSTDREYKNLPLILIGPQRAGKSTLIGNLSRDAIQAGECVVIFDYIASCQLSREVAELFPPDKQLIIDCGDPSKIQGLGYNEVGISADPFLQYDNAKKKATQLLTLVNAVNASGSTSETNLSAKMERYLTSAALVVFVSAGSFRDVFNVLQDHRKRREWLQKVPATQHENLTEYMSSLEELDEIDKRGIVIGTKDVLITGIIDRLNKLKANTFMEAMLKRSTAGNVDMVKELQKSQLITIRMPEAMFATDGERDIYATYWITKLWLALQIREQQTGGDRFKLTKVNLVIDELYQVENTQKFLSDKLSRLAKFGCKPIISAHYLNQIKYIRDELRSANASYMLISGCDKKNFDELKEELHPFVLEDLLRLPRYHSLNLIKSKDVYARFITALPKPVNRC